MRGEQTLAAEKTPDELHLFFQARAGLSQRDMPSDREEESRSKPEVPAARGKKKKKSTRVLPTAPLARSARDILRKIDPDAEPRMTPGAVEILGYADDVYLMELCWKVLELATHAGRITIQDKDFVRWQRICPEAAIPMPSLAEVLLVGDGRRRRRRK